MSGMQTVRWLDESPGLSGPSASVVRWLDAPADIEQVGQAAEVKVETNGWSTLWTVLGVAGTALGAYHGYKRNHGSLGWAVGWGIFGAFLPILSIPISLAQGFGKPR